jgi:hypothetical protein
MGEINEYKILVRKPEEKKPTWGFTKGAFLDQLCDSKILKKDSAPWIYSRSLDRSPRKL